MYNTRFKGSFKAVPIYVYKPRSIRKRTLGSISCNTTTSRPLRPILLNWVPLELLQDSDSSQETIGPHWASSFPEYLSPNWDKDKQHQVVWSRLRSIQTLANWKPSKTTERYHALCQEYQKTQVKPSHKPLFHDIKSNLTTVSRAEKVFKGGIPLNRRGEHNVPKKYHKTAIYTPEGDEQGYIVYHNGSFIPVEFDFTHCFWYTVKYDNQRSCWASHKLPPPEYGLDISTCIATSGRTIGTSGCH